MNIDPGRGGSVGNGLVINPGRGGSVAPGGEITLNPGCGGPTCVHDHLPDGVTADSLEARRVAWGDYEIRYENYEAAGLKPTVEDLVLMGALHDPMLYSISKVSGYTTQEMLVFMVMMQLGDIVQKDYLAGFKSLPCAFASLASSRPVS